MAQIELAGSGDTILRALDAHLSCDVFLRGNVLTLDGDEAAVAVGFGVSTPEQARALAAHADAVVVGSALVEALHRGGADPSAALALVRSLAEAVHSQAVH